MSKTVVCILAVIILISGSCSRENNKERKSRNIKLALIVKRTDIPWYQMQVKGFEDTCREENIQYLILDSKMDSNLVLTNIDTLISRNVDGVAIAVTEQAMSWIIVNRIFEAGIPIISLNYKLVDKQGRQLAPHIGVDYHKAGVSAGRWLSDRISDKKLLERPGVTPGIAELDSDSVLEITGWTDTVKSELLEKNSEITDDIFYRVNSRVNDAAGAMLAMQELLTTHPDVTDWIIYAGSSEEMSGALLALKQVGMSGYSISISIESEKTFYSKDHGVIFVDTYSQGKLAAQMLLKNIKYGIPVPSNTITLYKPEK